MIGLYFKIRVIEEIIGWIIVLFALIVFFIWFINFCHQCKMDEQEERRDNDGRTFTDIRDQK